MLPFLTRKKRINFLGRGTANKTAVSTQPREWKPLNLGRFQLSLPLTFPTGQTFRWKETAPSEFTGVVKSEMVSLKALGDGDIEYRFHQNDDATSGIVELLDYLNGGICLTDLWAGFSARDDVFSDLARRFPGVRVLRQDPLECLIQFLCSSNNNIGRITKMVDYISSLGGHIGTVGGFDFHQFPSLERLSRVSEDELRCAGFGYRAKYIIGTVRALSMKPDGVDWLTSLRSYDLGDAMDALCSLPGVGAKVAACVALFSLDQHSAIPVDTHVWKIASRHLVPGIAGVPLTSKRRGLVEEAFVNKYGEYAGWAQTLLFVAELPSQKRLADQVR